MNRYLAKLASLDEKRAYPSNPQNPQNPPKRGFEGFEGSLSSAFLPSAIPPTELPETPEPAGDAAADDTEQAVACRMMERDPSPFKAELGTLRIQCPTGVDHARWRQGIVDAETFIAVWGAQAQAFGWTVPELFGLHPVPEQPAANYDRLARVDDMGLIWLLRGRPVIVLKSTEAIIRCHSGATLKFYRRSEPALAETTNVAPATEIGNVMQIDKPTLHAAEIGKESTP
jgi:hypothetical protein